MAGAHYTVFSLVLPYNNPITRRNYPLLIVSSISTSNASKISHRKNHLRPKILKTLTKPYPPITPLLPQESPQQPSTPILSPPQIPEEHDIRVEVPTDGTHCESGAAVAVEGGELEGLQVSESTGDYGEYNGVAGKLSARSILKYGTYLVGAFVLQNIISVWIMLNDDSNQKAGNSETGDSDINAREKSSILFDGSEKSMGVTNGSNVFYVEDQSIYMEKKIEEIKVMAREARRIEEVKKEEEIEGPENDVESVVSDHRLGIDKKIGARLLKLQERVSSYKDKSGLLHAHNFGNSVKSSGGVTRDKKNVNKGNGASKFKKKHKYGSPSMKPTKAPKGFSGIRKYEASDAESRDSAGNGTATSLENRSTANDNVQILYEGKQIHPQDVQTQESDSRFSFEDGGNFVYEDAKTLPDAGKNLKEVMGRSNVETETGVKSNDISNGGFKQSSFGRSSVKVIQSRKSRELRTVKVEENQDTIPILEKDDVLSINGSPKHGIADNVSRVNRVKVKQTNTETDMWWLNLRYVLVILMRRGSDKEGPRGLYCLKITSKEEDQRDYFYTVAFEDQADANNFCFLLESFFEDLGDFSADAVPMSIQELLAAVKSHAKKVVVVKKRQLQLYAGQPLSDVEMTLCSLVEQRQNVYPAD